VKVRPFRAVSFLPCAMTATVGSVIAPVRSLVVREHWIETPGRRWLSSPRRIESEQPLQPGKFVHALSQARDASRLPRWQDRARVGQHRSTPRRLAVVSLNLDGAFPSENLGAHCARIVGPPRSEGISCVTGFWVRPASGFQRWRWAHDLR